MLPGKRVVNGFSLMEGIDGRKLDNPDAKRPLMRVLKNKNENSIVLVQTLKSLARIKMPASEIKKEMGIR